MILSPQTILECKDVSIGYSEANFSKVIAQNIDLQISKGKLIALVGGNGIGKSTFLKTLANILPPVSGSLELYGKALTSYSDQEIAKEISLVLTDKTLSKNLTVLELVALGRHPYTNWLGNLNKQDIAIIQQALQQTNILELQHKKCDTLSDGQLQKVMIARALAQNTNLILLDEPTTHLDIYHKASVLKLLKNIAYQTKKGILFSTHEIDLAIQLCDEMIVITKEKVHFGKPDEFIENGVFDELFPKDLVFFDKISKSFKVIKS